MTVSANLFVDVTPGVLSAGGNALAMNGICVTENARVPIGTVLSLPNPTAVQNYFGPTSHEATLAGVYFLGYNNSTMKPGAMLFAQYPASAVAGYLRGGNISLAQIRAVTPGTLTITFAGTPLVSSTITLSGAASPSIAAGIIQSAFSTPPFNVTYDSVSGAFVFTSTSTGSNETIIFPSDTIATPLMLTAATGAVLSQGAAAAAPSAFMAGITAVTQNWASFFLAFDPDGGSGFTQKMLFSEWTNSTDDRYAFIAWDTDITPTESVPATSSWGYALQQANLSGTNLNYEPSDQYLAAFVSGAIASINFSQKNGRITFAFKGQTGLIAGVTTDTAAINLGGDPQTPGSFGNGYNYYAAVATANQEFLFYQRGTVSGPWDWLDSYINQIWLNNQFQLALLSFMSQVNSFPYNPQGYALVEAACMDVIAAGLNFGAYVAGVPLSDAQTAEVNNAAGTDIAGILSTQGWYLQILPASPQVRQSRASPPMTFWYMDGESIQAISLASVDVQ
jgi:hypothetical protein